MSLKVKAVEGRLVLRLGAPGRHFVGYRECNRGSDGEYRIDETVHHIVAAAPGITKFSQDAQGRVVSLEQTSDLFLAGQEKWLTRFDDKGQPLIEAVPDDSYYRTMIAEGGLQRVDKEE